jgi:hypothetical protein
VEAKDPKALTSLDGIYPKERVGPLVLDKIQPKSDCYMSWHFLEYDFAIR